jgi:HK97 family phage portal protein
MNNFWQSLLTLIRNPRSEVISTSADLLAFLDKNGMDNWSGIELSDKQAMEYPPLETAVRVLEEGIAQLPLHIFERKEDNRKDIDREFHISRLLKRPNEFQTGVEWRSWCIRHAVTTGDAVSFINRNTRTGEILEILPIDRKRVQIEQDERWRLTYNILQLDGSKRTYGRDSVFHFRGPSEDGITGINFIHRHRQAIALGLAQDRVAAKLFSRGALISGAFVSQRRLTDKQRQENEDALRRAYSGDNAGSFALMDGGMDFKPIMMELDKAQLLESRQLQRAIVVSLLRVPMHMAGDLDRATMSNIMTLARQAVDYVFMPWLVRFEQAIDYQLMTEAERASRFAKHNVTSLLRGDPKERADFYASAIQNKWMSPNEVRDVEDLNPYAGGDEYHGAENIYGDGDDAGEVEEPTIRAVRPAQANTL